MYISLKQIVLCLCIAVFLTRLIFWLKSRVFSTLDVCSNKKSIVENANDHNKVKLIAVLGSGGHTSELLMLIKDMDFKNKVSLTCVLAKSDLFSKEKALTILSESMNVSKHHVQNYVQFHKIRRSREVYQSYLTSILTTLLSLFESLLFLYNTKYDLILVNGPGTCIPICFGSLILEVSDFV